MEKRGQLIIISGPAGTGKGTVVKKLLERNGDMSLSISATTRGPRPCETDGVEYYFKRRQEFEKMISEDAFIEYAEYNGNLYGTPKKAVLDKLEQGISVILEIEVQGAANAAKAFPEAILVFLAPPSMEVLRARLTGRGTETADVIENRMKIAERELHRAEDYHYIVVNDTVEEAAERIECILTAESLKVSKNKALLDSLNK